MATKSPTTIEDQLRTAWNQERRFCHARGLSRSIVWLALILILAFVIDRWLLFSNRVPTGVTLLLSLAGIATMAWVIWKDWIRKLRPYDATRIALEVEGRHPELMSSLVSYTQMESMTGPTQASDELLQAMRDFALTKSRSLNFSDIIDFSQLKKLIAYAGGVLVLTAALSVSWSDYLGAFMQRMAGIDTVYPTRTKIVEITGDVLVRRGDNVEITVRPGGVIPDEAFIHVRSAGGDDATWTSLPMENVNAGRVFLRELEALDRDTQYYVTLGDQRSDPFLITTVRSPKIVSAELLLTYPAYLNRDPGKTDQLNVELPEGTRVEWKLRCDKPVGQLGVVYGDKRIDADITDSGRGISFSLTADLSFAYTFEWTEGESGKSFQFPDVEYSVRVVRDSRPKIAFRSQAPEGLATTAKKAVIHFQAQDDNGLGRIYLVYTVTEPGQSETPKENRILLREASGRSTYKATYAWRVAKHVANLAPGKQVSYRLEASDLQPNGKDKRVTYSSSHQLTFVENAEYLDWYRREMVGHNESVKIFFRTELSASKKIKQLLKNQSEAKK
jgi:hypothetical protein